MKWANKKETYLVTILTILCIVCFPFNPLVFTGVIEVESYNVLSILGWVVWAFGMVLVMGLPYLIAGVLLLYAWKTSK